MKKGLTLLCNGLILVSLAACSKNSSKKTSSKTAKKTEQVAHKKSKKETKKKTTIAASDKESKNDLGNTKEFSVMIKGAQSQVPSLKEKFGDMYKEISIEEGKDSTMIYKYTFSQTVEQEVDAEGLKSTLTEEFKPIMDQAKEMFPNIKMEIHYLNPDGSDVASFTITKEDTDKVE